MEYCLVCGNEYKSQLSLSKHIKSHGLTSKEYYDKYYKTDDDGCCLFCGDETKFINGVKGYKKYCYL